jgi:uncharacterized protein (UPF0332 family)
LHANGHASARKIPKIPRSHNSKTKTSAHWRLTAAQHHTIHRYHYVTALLLTKGLEARSHEGLVRMFNLHFIKTGLLPKECSAILSHAQRAREEADYWPEIPFSKEDADLRITEIKRLIIQIKNLLRSPV